MIEKFALILAVEQYLNSEITPVKYAENDANEFAKALNLHGYEPSNIRLLLSSAATKATVESRLNSMLSHAGEDDYVTIFYAGHGFAENEHNYLTCADTIRDDLVRTSIPLHSILLSIRKSRCNHILIFLD